MHNQLAKEIIELIVKNSVIPNTDTLLKCNIKIKILYFIIPSTRIFIHYNF